MIKLFLLLFLFSCNGFRVDLTPRVESSGNFPANLLNNQVNLLEFWARDNQFSGTIPPNLFDNNLLLKELYLFGNSFSGAISANIFVNNLDLEVVAVHSNQFTSAPSLLNNTKIDDFNISSNQLPIADINQILIDLDSHATSGGTLSIQGQLPSAPSGAGATANTNLIGRGWTVTSD